MKRSLAAELPRSITKGIDAVSIGCATIVIRTLGQSLKP